jgi:hypothetical protein
MTIPVRLTLAERCAVALASAAADLDTADDAGKFVAALESNYRLWVILAEVARRNELSAPDSRLADYVVTASGKSGSAIRDEVIETLIGINREVSARLAEGRDLAAIRQRAELAWQENSQEWNLSLQRWLMQEIERKGRLH